MPETLEAVLARLGHARFEGQFVEYKAARGGTPKIYDTLSSFSNQAEGGVIVFGIDESRDCEIIGVADVQELERGVYAQCKEMTPVVRPVFEEAMRSGKAVVAARIPGLPMGERPAYRTVSGITRGAYTRIGDSDEHMTAGEIYAINAFKNGVRDDVAVSPISKRDMLDDDSVTSFVIRAKKDKPRMAGRTPEDVLQLLGAVRDGAPTLAGLMCLSDYPQQVYPNCCITAVAVAGTEMAIGEGGERFLDSRSIEGPIADMIDEALAFVARNTRYRTVIEGAERRDVPEYPEVALREVITNALVHRDYGPYANGTPARLIVYADRIECWNPGGIYGGQSVAKLGRENMPTRNPSLITLLDVLDIVENRHSGVPVIREAMASHGLPGPEFLDRGDSFSVVLRAGMLEGLPQVATREVGERRLHTIADEDDVMAFCATPRSRGEVADFLGIGQDAAMRTYLAPLVAQGRLRMTMPDKPRSKFQRFVRAECQPTSLPTIAPHA